MTTPKGDTAEPSPKNGKVEEAPDEQSGIHASTDQVPVSEEFQKATHALVSKAKMPHIMHLRNAINTREDKMRAEEKPEDKDTPETMSADNMPESSY